MHNLSSDRNLSRCECESVFASPQMLLLLAGAFAGLVNFYSVFSIIPFDASSLGHREDAGLPNGAMMIAAVVAEFAVPWLVRHLGYRHSLRLGLLLLAGPTIALISAPAMAVLVGLNVLRGLGLGVLFVVGAPMAAALAGPHRQRGALALYGVVAGIPALLVLPLSVFVAEKFGTHWVYLLGGALALIGMIAVPDVPMPPRDAVKQHGSLYGNHIRLLAVPVMAFFLAAAANGAALILLPQAPEAVDAPALVVALIVNGAAMLGLRAASPMLMNRQAPLLLLALSVLACGLGLATLGLSLAPWSMVLGMAALGGAFGLAQNVSLSVLSEAVPGDQHDLASVIWSVAYDGGLGAGPWASGLIVAALGLPRAFISVSASFVALAALVWLSSLTAPVRSPQPKQQRP